MKKTGFIQVGMVCLGFCLWGCPSHKNEVYTLAASIRGTWEWVKTTSPTRTTTPQTLGYSQQLSIGTDETGNVVAFFKNDLIQRRLYETKTDTNHVFVDEVRQTVLIQYGKSGYIKYLIVNGQNSTTLTVSEVLNPYTLQADTIQHVYQKSSKKLFPY
jgi:hypothetical protein